MDIVQQIINLEEYYQETKTLLPEAEEELDKGIAHYCTMEEWEDLEEYENSLRSLFNNVMKLRIQFNNCKNYRAQLWN